jgi:hypothetical protein
MIIGDIHEKNLAGRHDSTVAGVFHFGAEGY